MKGVLLAALLVAQLDPTSGVPLSGNEPAPSGDTVLVRLPRSFGMSQRVLAHHGTAIYKLAEWKAVCPAKARKPKVTVIDGVLFEERRDESYAVRTISSERDFPLSCGMQRARYRFTLVFEDPGRKKSPALAAKTPDYIVP